MKYEYLYLYSYMAKALCILLVTEFKFTILVQNLKNQWQAVVSFGFHKMEGIGLDEQVLASKGGL
jgi:hypothetical protein